MNSQTLKLRSCFEVESAIARSPSLRVRQQIERKDGTLACVCSQSATHTGVDTHIHHMHPQKNTSDTVSNTRLCTFRTILAVSSTASSEAAYDRTCLHPEQLTRSRNRGDSHLRAIGILPIDARSAGPKGTPRPFPTPLQHSHNLSSGWAVHSHRYRGGMSDHGVACTQPRVQHAHTHMGVMEKVM